MDNSADIEFKVGRRSNDGIIRLSSHPADLLQMSVSYKGERSASVVLTRDQVKELRQALMELEKEMSDGNAGSQTWDNRERRSEEPVLTPEGH